VLVLFAFSLFISAVLLFLVQPMFTKMVLPKLGGTPAVWITCMVFYQAALLLGYVYAHVTARWLGVRRQALVHLALLGSAFFFLPIGITQGWVPPPEANPAHWLLMLLLVSVGLPFFVISITAPMLQKWFAHTGHPEAQDPYFLYASSNLGSMAALLGYPTLVEPHLTLAQQSWVWTLGYGLLGTIIIACGLVLWLSPASGASDMSVAVVPTALAKGYNPALTWRQRLWWLLWSFAPSSLLLGVTTYLTTDIAAVPLLWVIPLALYLLTFVLVFARRTLVSHTLMIRIQPFLILPLALLFLWGMQAEWVMALPLHLLAFFVTAMVCHGELARSRPPTVHLTEFYLWIAVGGVLGGLFNALVAPMVFTSLAEYPLAMVLACLLRPTLAAGKRHSLFLDFALPLALGLVLAAVIKGSYLHSVTNSLMVIISFITALGCYSFNSRPLRFGLGVAAIMIGGMFYRIGGYPVIHGERSFFGVISVKSDPGAYYRLFYHGTTLHGAQSNNPQRRREPLVYYHPSGPIGQVFSVFYGAPTPREVAIVGLGTGSLACFASPGQHWTFYEIDPAVERIARDPQYFTYLQDCTAQFEVVLGDGRLSLARAPDRHFGLIVFDAFSSDAVPIHLINREALKLYLEKLAEGGLLVFHISNRFLDLRPVLGNLAQDAGLTALVQEYNVSDEEQRACYVPTIWVVMARKEADLGNLVANENWQPLLVKPRGKLWTDDFSDILSVFMWPSFTLPEPEKTLHSLAGQWDKTEQALRRNLSLEPDKEGHAVELARFLNKRGRAKEAEQALKDFLIKHPQDTVIRFFLADFYLNQGREDRTQKLLDESIAQDPTSPKGRQAKNLLARLLLSQGRLNEAAKQVANILKDNPKDLGAIQTQGLIALEKHDGVGAMRSFGVLTQDQPQNPEAWLLAARAHLLNKEPEQAKEKTRKALELKPDFLEARNFLYAIHLEAKDYDGAIQTIQGYLRKNEKDLFNLISLGNAYALSGDYDKARAQFQKIIELAPQNPQGYYQQALLSHKAKKPEEALKLSEEALSYAPGYLPALKLLVRVSLEQKHPDQALAAVRRELAGNPKNPQLLQLLGELLLDQAPQDAATALEEALVSKPASKQVRQLLNLAYRRFPDQEQVLRHLEERVADPKAPAFYSLTLANLYVKQQKFDKAVALYNTMIDQDFFLTMSRNNLAYLLANHAPTPENLEKAFQLASANQEENPDNPDTADTLGWILCKQGRYVEAKPHLERGAAFSKHPSLLYHLGWCNARLGETKAARAALQKALESKGQFPEEEEAEKLLKTLPGEGKSP
jgi:pentatricopeptide repeat protein